MSLARIGKLLRCFGISAFLWLALPAPSWAQSCPTCVAATCGTSCNWLHCPPHYKHCQERPPCIRFHCACPHPVANPCTLPHWGYYETCWYPWPFPPTQCNPPTPAQMVALNPFQNPNQPQTDPRQPRMGPPSGVMPTPRMPASLAPLTSEPDGNLPPPRTLLPR